MLTRHGKFEGSAQTLAAMLAEGAQAEVVGGEHLTGATQVWIDQEMQIQWQPGKAANGVYVRWPDDRTAMFVTDQRAAAERLLGRAREIAGTL